MLGAKVNWKYTRSHRDESPASNNLNHSLILGDLGFLVHLATFQKKICREIISS
jgi:hypothetical protein